MAQSRAYIVTDLGYGDSGKGTTTDFLVRAAHASLVIRHNGGAQAAHHVVAPDGKKHTFSQFGSGTLVPGTRTHLSRFMLVHPIVMLTEEERLRSIGVTDAFERTTISGEALVTTPFHQSANRLREMARGKGRHGSCGLGIGETMQDSISYPGDSVRVREIGSYSAAAKLKRIQERKREELVDVLPELSRDDPATARELRVLEDSEAVSACLGWFDDFLRRANIVGEEYLRGALEANEAVVFEGAQGVLIDEWYGFHPYTTWSTTTPANAIHLLGDAEYQGRVISLGVIRAYATRHGPGPFVTEDEDLTRTLPDRTNGMNDWQREFRVGWLDFVVLRYALKVAGNVDCLVLTHLDRFQTLKKKFVCNSYTHKREERHDIEPGTKRDLRYQEGLTRFLTGCRPVYEEVFDDIIGVVEQKLCTPVAITSSGPSACEKSMRIPKALWV